MTDEEFEKVLEERLEKTRRVLALKSKEYRRGEDKLSNFKRAAGAADCTPERALAGMMLKHTVSVLDLINDLERGVVTPYDVWDEKIGDNINYLHLLDGLIRERLRHDI